MNLLTPSLTPLPSSLSLSSSTACEINVNQINPQEQITLRCGVFCDGRCRRYMIQFCTFVVPTNSNDDDDDDRMIITEWNDVLLMKKRMMMMMITE
jgi:hypothetical protein